MVCRTPLTNYKRFTTRRLIDLQAGLIEAFEKIVISTKGRTRKYP